MSVLVFGSTGQVARELKRQLPAALFLDRAACDLERQGAADAAIRSAGCKTVINVAAYTAVQAAERELERAQQVNAAAPAEMAAACAALSIPLIHVSTDYVFDGTGDTPWKPSDRCEPATVYGKSKLDGENAIRESGGPHVILRTSWVFSEHGGNFVRTMLRLSSERDALNVVSDQVGGPTSAGSIAAGLKRIAEIVAADHEVTGTYHFSGFPDVSWAEFARAIFQHAGAPTQVHDIATADYPSPVPRPLNSRLDCTATEAVFDIKRPRWQSDLAGVVARIRETS